MWELIQANKRKSIILFVAMGLCLVMLGYAIGKYLSPGDGGVFGVLIALFIWGILSLVSYFRGDSIILAMSHAKKVTPDIHPQLFNIVEEMKISAGLPAMPKIYIINEPAPNAFATGIRADNCAVAVTAGLLSRLNRDELQGVIAHEMSHILNRDVLFMSFAGVMMGSIIFISEVFLRSMWYSSASSSRYRSRRSSKEGGQGQMILMLVAIAAAVLAPIISQLLYFAISRKREYLADASAVRLTRYPEGLASALEKIANSNIDFTSVSKATAPLYIINPLQRKSLKFSSLTSTHPPVNERIEILRNMMHGAGLLDYQRAFSKTKRTSSQIIPGSGLSRREDISIREASVEKHTHTAKKKDARDLGDLMLAVNKYAFIACVCGLTMKIPPEYKDSSITCPRCAREHIVPLAELAAIAAAGGDLEDKKHQDKG